MRTHTIKAVVLATAIMGLMALPAAASAQVSWADGAGDVLGSNSNDGPTGYDDRVTANVEGEMSFGSFSLSADCDVTGEVELWNDGADWAPAKNQVVSLDFSNCYGTITGCQVTGAAAENLPWSGDLVDSSQSNFSDVRITWSANCLGTPMTGWRPTTGTLDALLPADGNHCLESFDFEGQDLLFSGVDTAIVNGSLEVQSVDGLDYSPANCVVALS